MDVERWLLPVLLLAFGAAAGATLAARPATVAATLTVAEPPAVTAATPPDRAAPAPEGFLRLTVADVVLTEGASRSAVLLTGLDDGFVLPLFVEAEAGLGLQQRLEALSAELPPLAQAISATGGEVMRVELTTGDEGPTARLVVAQDGEEHPLETGVSEALSVALARGATIWVEPALISQHAFDTSGLTTPEGGTASHLRAPARM